MRFPKGYRDKYGHTKICVNLTHDTFNRLLARAKAENKMFSVVAEDVILCGLLCLEESEALEPKDEKVIKFPPR